jgi:hypothetical protein
MPYGLASNRLLTRFQHKRRDDARGRFLHIGERIRVFVQRERDGRMTETL